MAGGRGFGFGAWGERSGKSSGMLLVGRNFRLKGLCTSCTGDKSGPRVLIACFVLGCPVDVRWRRISLWARGGYWGKSTRLFITTVDARVGRAGALLLRTSGAWRRFWRGSPARPRS